MHLFACTSAVQSRSTGHLMSGPLKLCAELAAELCGADPTPLDAVELRKTDSDRLLRTELWRDEEEPLTQTQHCPPHVPAPQVPPHCTVWPGSQARSKRRHWLPRISTVQKLPPGHCTGVTLLWSEETLLCAEETALRNDDATALDCVELRRTEMLDLGELTETLTRLDTREDPTPLEELPGVETLLSPEEITEEPEVRCELIDELLRSELVEGPELVEWVELVRLETTREDCAPLETMELCRLAMPDERPPTDESGLVVETVVLETLTERNELLDVTQACGNSTQNGLAELKRIELTVELRELAVTTLTVLLTVMRLELLLPTHTQHWPPQVPAPQEPVHWSVCPASQARSNRKHWFPLISTVQSLLSGHC